MLLVIDANIVLSALVKGRLTGLILSPMLELVAPERLFEEIGRNKGEILARSSFSAADFEALLALLEKNIRIVPLEDIISFVPEAEKILGGHRKDVPFLALALKSCCSVWSYEKRFKRIGGIVSLTTAEVRKMLRIFGEYLKAGKLSDEDRKFCEKVGWHPADEFPLRDEVIKELKAREESSGKPMTLDEFNKWCDSL